MSKKLNVPPPEQLNLEDCLQFLLELPAKTSLVWLCIAKLLVHISPHKALMPTNLKPEEAL
jgi:hypothetical protein